MCMHIRDDTNTPSMSCDTISTSKCYSPSKRRNELRYYEPPNLVTYGLPISVR